MVSRRFAAAVVVGATKTGASMRVFLADLGHNQVTYSSDTYPLGVANLISYAQAYANLNEPLEFKLFREPQDLKAAVDDAPPDVLGLSSYAWNHTLAVHFAHYTKQRAPQVMTLMGGPNFPLTLDEQMTFMQDLPDIDVFVRGPTYEAERAFLNIVRRYSETGHSLKELKAEPVPGNLWVDQDSGTLVQGTDVERIHDLDEIPSPYKGGLLDPFFGTGYFPLLQIARGCPFTCQFCNSSARSNSKIYAHSLSNVRDDLQYIAERIHRESPICFADDNFGMYPLDEEIADYLAYLQDRFGWPRYIRTTTGKNRSERIIKVMRKVRGALPMTAAVQSLNPVVLENIKRTNVSLTAYAEIQKEVLAQGMQSYGELILCLPGETMESHLKAVRDLLASGVKRVSAHQLMLLHGAPLSNPDSREQFGFKTRFRVVARNIGDYTGEPIIETEEVVVETPTFSFDDYLESRILHVLLAIYYYEGNFEEAFEFAKQQGIEPFDLIRHLQSMLPQAPAGFAQVMEEFLQETRDELFFTREECLNWSQRHFDGLVKGTVGGNLLSKYSMLGRFYATQDALSFLQAGITSALGHAVIPERLEQLDAVFGYLRSSILHYPFRESLAASPQWTSCYDVEQWCKDSYAQDLDAYRSEEPVTFGTAVDQELRSVLEQRIDTFGEHPSGLGKFTRTLFARDLRRKVTAR
jgi:radical SAM superfamily enzyme YgiQ (UPF0313 family)